MSNITVTLTGANGDSIVLGNDATEYDYVINKSVSGLALPPVSIRLDEGVSDGGYYISSRRLPRDIDMPITIIGEDRDDVEDKFRRFAKLLSDRAGATRITVTYADESEWYIDGYYMSGGNVTYGSNATSEFASLGISFRCPNPYWTSDTTTSATYTTLGNKTITNTGDIDSYPVWTITGPSTNITFTSPSGETWTYLSSIGSGVVRIIDTFEKTVVDGAGVNKYSELGATPNLFAIPAGTPIINIAGGTLTGSIQVQFKPRKEIVF
jgi:phage-related protein